MTDSYEDILHLPHHVSAKRRRMSNVERAAQFSPFAALTSYGEAVEETARLTQEKLELDESAKAEINDRLLWLAQHIRELPGVRVTYFAPDERQTGGQYVTEVGALRRIDEYNHVIVMENGLEIPMEDIFDLKAERKSEE